MHDALFYRDEATYLNGVVPFVQAGLAAGVPPPDGDLPPLESQLCHTISAHKAAKK